MDSLEQRIYAGIERGLLPLLAFLLAFITAGVFIQVVMRYFFAASFLWGEELSLFAFIWCAYLGTAICSFRRTHFAFSAFDEILKGRNADIHQLVIAIGVAVVTTVMVTEGWYFSQVSLQRLSPALGITLFIPTIVIPVSGVLMLMVNIFDIVRASRRIFSGAAR